MIILGFVISDDPKCSWHYASCIGFYTLISCTSLVMHVILSYSLIDCVPRCFRARSIVVLRRGIIHLGEAKKDRYSRGEAVWRDAGRARTNKCGSDAVASELYFFKTPASQLHRSATYPARCACLSLSAARSERLNTHSRALAIRIYESSI